MCSLLQLHDYHVRDRGDGCGQCSAAMEEEGAGGGENRLSLAQEMSVMVDGSRSNANQILEMSDVNTTLFTLSRRNTGTNVNIDVFPS